MWIVSYNEDMEVPVLLNKKDKVSLIQSGKDLEYAKRLAAKLNQVDAPDYQDDGK